MVAMVTFVFDREKVLLDSIDERAQGCGSCEMRFELGSRKRRLVQDTQIGEQVGVDQSGSNGVKISKSDSVLNQAKRNTVVLVTW